MSIKVSELPAEAVLEGVADLAADVRHLVPGQHHSVLQIISKLFESKNIIFSTYSVFPALSHVLVVQLDFEECFEELLRQLYYSRRGFGYDEVVLYDIR